MKKHPVDQQTRWLLAISVVWTTIFGTVSYKGTDLIVSAMIASMVTTTSVILTSMLGKGRTVS